MTKIPRQPGEPKTRKETLFDFLDAYASSSSATVLHPSVNGRRYIFLHLVRFSIGSERSRFENNTKKPPPTPLVRRSQPLASGRSPQFEALYVVILATVSRDFVAITGGVVFTLH